jgi:hypothetical protein
MITFNRNWVYAIVALTIIAEVALCDPNGNTIKRLDPNEVHSEDECQRAGLKTLWDAPRGMQGKVVVCLKGVR